MPAAAAWVRARHWAIAPDWLEVIEEIATREGPGPEAVAARLGRPLANTRTVTMRDGVAVIPVTGPMFRYANLFTEISGATSVEQLALDFRAALDDPTVRAIVLDVNSPGGEADGVAEFASQVFQARGSKPITAYVGGTGASGAYWIASAAEKVVAGPTAMLGSIGVIASFDDRSKQLEAAGVKRTIITSRQSPLKNADPSADGPGRAAVQAVIDALADRFIGAVAKYRGVSKDKVEQKFGQGSILVGSDAVAAGMADRVSTLEEVIAELAAAGSGNHTMKGPAAAGRPSANQENPMPETPVQPAAPTTAPAPVIPAAAAPDAAAIEARLRGEIAAEHKEIADLCALAGKPAMAADFIAKGLKPEAVRKALTDARAAEADAADIAGQHSGAARPGGENHNALWDSAVAQANARRGFKAKA